MRIHGSLFRNMSITQVIQSETGPRVAILKNKTRPNGEADSEQEELKSGNVLALGLVEG